MKKVKGIKTQHAIRYTHPAYSKYGSRYADMYCTICENKSGYMSDRTFNKFRRNPKIRFIAECYNCSMKMKPEYAKQANEISEESRKSLQEYSKKFNEYLRRMYF